MTEAVKHWQFFEQGGDVRIITETKILIWKHDNGLNSKIEIKTKTYVQII